MMRNEKMVKEEVDAAAKADKMKDVSDTASSDSEVVKLKNDGNVTRQIYEAIGHETLQSYYSKH